MVCRDCDFIKEEYDRLEAYYKQKGYPKEEYDTWLVKECYCEKVGGKIGHFGMCSDVDIEPIIEDNKETIIERKLKGRRRRNDELLHKRKLKWQYQNITKYPGASYPVDKNGNFNDEDIAYYRKIYKSSHNERYKFHKQKANKKVRRMPLFVCTQRGLYKKAYEYKWEVN